MVLSAEFEENHRRTSEA